MKKIVSLFLICSMVVGSLSLSFAGTSTEIYTQEFEKITFQDLLTDPKYKELDIDKEEVKELIKLQNKELLVLQSNRATTSSYSASEVISKVNTYYQNANNTWGHLTNSEKNIIIANPVSGYLAYTCAQTANNKTVTRYGVSRIGDGTDAYRHTIWNALMEKYISEGFAQAYATAHEDYPESELKNTLSRNSNGFLDGYTLWNHCQMDLHNNAVGRSLIKAYEETYAISENEIESRVLQAIRNAEVYWLYAY